ncbi:MAG: GtrA family protein [Halioglobus sp.]|nr:GtrA family protein [Halioglobus sp.]
MKLSGEFYRFAVVGSVGFVIDASVLQILASWFGVGLLVGRVFSYLAAATVTWFLHRHYTFRDQLSPADTHSASARAMLDQWLRFILTNGIGASLNYGVYAACILGSELCHSYPVIAVAIGSVTALVFNFTISRRFVFVGNPKP